MAVEGDRSTNRISVEVAWAEPRRQWLRSFDVAEGTTARQAVVQSGIDSEWPEVDVRQVPLGIFSRRLDGRQLPLAEDYAVQPGDRVEIYRPLEIDPKQARRERASRQ